MDAKNFEDNLEKEAERQAKAEAIQEQVKAKEEEGYDGFSDTKIKLIPTPRFSDSVTVGTMLPINMANEVVTNLTLLAKQFDFIDFLKQKLNYPTKLQVVESFASEQIDALVMAIRSFEKGNGFILGDMAGIGKGRVCAGIMRYAYTQGIIPVFLTQKPYLLNDIYRDLSDIGGIGSKNGKPVVPRPFILHKDGVILDRDGNVVKTDQALKYTTTRDNQVIPSFVERANPASIYNICEETIDRINKTGVIALPKNYNCVMLPYSVISSGKTSTKRDFLAEISYNSIFIFDESHNAASEKKDSKILRTAIPLIKASKGVLFSSATYAKRPNVFNLYVVKTSLKTAVPSLDAIDDALKVGGENVSEYIASGLAQEGEMIRRERSFGDCEKITEYVGASRRQDSFGNDIYDKNPDDIQKRIFDEAIGYFKEMRDFSRSELAADATHNAVIRKMEELRKQQADMAAYQTAKNSDDDDVKREFIQNNRNKWIPVYERDSITRYKATFIRNLFLAVKAKFSADKIIDCLNNPVEYQNLDGTRQVAPMKPIIAVSNTGEAIFNELRFKDGDEVENDFSLYLRAIFNKLFTGNLKLIKVDNNIFERDDELEERGVERTIIKTEYEVLADDFPDQGQRVEEIQEMLENYTSELPFSIIDYLQDRIEQTPRSGVYFDQTGQPKFGYASSPYYTFGEATSRKNRLKRGEDGILRYTTNDRIKSTTKIFRAFNNGALDVMLINVVASTGGSAQSSPREGIDTRKRNMFIIQFELDINIEVQKRGRVNRTGQLNSPTYTYIISQIPAEVRTYLMLRRKLRKLDANTSADQTASSKTNEIKDIDGNPIEDIFNQYGFEVFEKDFITQPENTLYLDVFKSLKWNKVALRSDATNPVNVDDTNPADVTPPVSAPVTPSASSDSATVENNETAEEVELNLEAFNAFIRELEFFPSELPPPPPPQAGETRSPRPVDQTYFYDTMNELYRAEKTRRISIGDWQEELQTQNYRASIRQKTVIQLNSGTTIFSRPLFLADYYTLETKRPWTKDIVEQKMNSLAVWEGRQLSPDEAYGEFVNSFLEELVIQREAKISDLLRKQPKREDFTNQTIIRLDDKSDGEVTTTGELQYRAAVSRFNTEYNYALSTYDILENSFKRLISYFTPNKKVLYRGIYGLFIGYKIKKTDTRFKYTRGNIELHFCFLSRYPHLVLKPTTGIEDLRQIQRETLWLDNSLNGLLFDYQQNLPDAKKAELVQENRSLANMIVQKITDWIPNMTARIIRRFMSGNILSGIVQANAKRRSGEIRGWVLQRFTNFDGSITTAIELKFTGELPETTTIENQELSISSGSTNILDFLDQMPVSVGISGVEAAGDRYAIFPIWNLETDTIIDRAVCIIKREGRFEIEIMQAQKKPKGWKKGDPVVYMNPEPSSTTYNRLFHNDEFRVRFQSFLASEDITTIYHALKLTKADKGGTKTSYNKFVVRLRRYVFDETDRVNLQAIFNEMHRLYDVTFNFRSDTASYFNVGADEPLADVTDVKVESKLYPEGDYEYRFINPVNTSIVSSIPNVKKKTDEGAYGGVILSQPIMPNLLPAYQMKPYKFPNLVYVKLALSVLNEKDKIDFSKELEEMADKDKDTMEFGEYVRNFINTKSVGVQYVFGDLRVREYGIIFKEYALKKDLSLLVIKEKIGDVDIERPKQTQVTITGAEDFIIKLLSEI